VIFYSESARIRPVALPTSDSSLVKYTRYRIKTNTPTTGSGDYVDCRFSGDCVDCRVVMCSVINVKQVQEDNENEWPCKHDNLKENIFHTGTE